MPREVLKLPLIGAAFAVLLDVYVTRTCYTDNTGTSQSAVDTAGSLLSFVVAAATNYHTGSTRYQ